jgi:hypothetical protein
VLDKAGQKALAITSATPSKCGSLSETGGAVEARILNSLKRKRPTIRTHTSSQISSNFFLIVKSLAL